MIYSCYSSYNFLLISIIYQNIMKTKSNLILIVALMLLFAVDVKAQLQTLYENFEGGVPSTWDITYSSSNQKWKSNTSYGCQGSTKSVTFNSTTSDVGTTSTLISPMLEVTSDKIFSFCYRNARGGEYSVYIYEYSADGLTYVEHLLESGLVAEDWSVKTYQLKASLYPNKKIKIAFKGVSNKARENNNGGVSQLSIQYGNQFLDNVVLEDVPLCAAPKDIDLMSLTQNSATIVWDIDPINNIVPTNFRITVRDLAGDSILGKYNDFLFVGDGNVCSIEGLKSDSRYAVTLRSDCSEDDKGVSKYSDDFIFKTLCEPSNLPYIENFDATERLLPSCWLINPDNQASVEISSDGFGYGGEGYSLKFAGNPTKSAYIVTDQFAHAGNDLEVSFMVFCRNGKLPFSVGLTNDALMPENFDVIWQDTTASGGWKEVRFCTDASFYSSENISLFIMLSAGFSSSDNFYIDNFTIKKRPTCPRLERLRLVEVDANSAVLGWSEFGHASNYEVELTIGTIVTTREVISDKAQCGIDGLVGNSSYTVRIRPICGDSEGEWSLPFTFKTNCDVMASNDFRESFEASSNKIPECWQVKQFAAGYGEGEDYGEEAIVVYEPKSTLEPGVDVDVAKHGNKVLMFKKSKQGTRTAIITQAMHMEQVGMYDVSFWMYRNSKETQVGTDLLSDDVRVLVNNTPDTIGAIELDYINSFYGHTPIVDGPGYYLYEYNIPLSGEVYFMIEAISEVGEANLYVDDIQVYPAPTCRKIKNIEMLPPTKNEFAMSWKKGVDETQWIVRYRLTNPNSGATIRNEETLVSGTPEFKISGLLHSTEYRIAGKVASYCGGADTSDWVDFDYRFETECEAISILPHVESFSGDRFPPICWSITGDNLDIERNTSSTFGYDNNGCVSFDAGENEALCTPFFSFEANKTYRVSFMMRRSSGVGGIKVLLNSVADSVGAQELLYIPRLATDNPRVSSDGYYEYKVDFTAEGEKCLIFKQTLSQFGGQNDYIDNIIVSEKPVCENVKDFVVDNVRSYTARVVLLDEGVTTCEASVCASGVSPEAGTFFSSNSAIIELKNLAPNTEYDVYVRNTCGANKGAWSIVKHTFITHCEPFEVTSTVSFEESFEDFAESAFIEGCYLNGVNLFKAKKTDGSVEALQEAYSGELYAWSQSGEMIIYRPLKLKAGVYYEISAYAAQGGNRSHISLGYAEEPIKDSVSFVLFEETIASSWNKHFGYFQVPKDGVYYICVKAYASSSIGLDNLVVREVYCVPPTTSIVDLMSSSATIQINELDAEKWIVSVSDYDFKATEVKGNILYDTVTSQYVDLQSLQSNTNYYYSIKSLCGEGDESSWSETREFRTKCSALSVPFTEGFEADMNCWTFLGDEHYANNPEGVPYKHSGNRALMANKLTMVSPELDVETLTDYMLTGWIMVRNTLPEGDITIGVMTNPDDVATFQPIGYYKIKQTNVFEKFTMYFKDLALDDYAEFRNARHVVVILPNEEASFYLDDIEVNLAPTCIAPIEAKYLDVTENSCTIGWESKGSAASWKIVGKRGDKVVVDTIVNTNPVIISNLLHSTEYSFEIQTICGNDEYSEIASLGTVVTKCGNWELPYFEDFSKGVLPLCWEVLDGAGWFVEHQDKENRLYFPSNAKNKEDYRGTILTPIFDLTQEKGALLHINLLNTTDTLIIRLSKDGGKTYPIELGKGYKDISTYTRFTFDLTPYVGNLVRVSLEGKATGELTSHLLINEIEIEKIEDCSRPMLSVKSVFGTAATVEITDTTGGVLWEYVCLREGDFIEDVDSFVRVSEKNFKIENLLGSTKYDLYVRGVCGEQHSSWRKVSFKTLCAEVNPIPYFEGFEGIENAREGCFSLLTNSTSQTLPAGALTSSYKSEGSNGFYFLTSQDYPMLLVFPKFDVPTTSLKLTLDYLSVKSNSRHCDLRIGVLTDVEDVESFKEVAVFTPFEAHRDENGNDLFDEISVVFNVLDLEYANSRIAMCAGPTKEDYSNVYIDNIKVERAPKCPDVYDMSLVSVGENSARIAVDYQAAAVQLAYGPAIQDIDSMTRIISVLDTIDILNLLEGTNYAVYARSVCGSDTGAWVTPLLFGTNCEALIINDSTIYEEMFNVYGTHPLAFPPCYTRMETVIEKGIEYPKLTQAQEGQGDKNVLHLYKGAKVALPEFNLSLDKLIITFDTYNPTTGTYIELGVQESLDDDTSYKTIKEMYVSQNKKTQEFDFSDYNVIGKYIVFKGDLATKDVYIDNIRVFKAPECFVPEDLKLEVVGDTFAVVSWKHSALAVKYECELISDKGKQTFEVDTTLGNCVITNLTPDTEYNLKVRTVCDVVTDWSDSLAFKTFSSLADLPYQCGFEDGIENDAWVFVNGGQRNKFVIAGNSNNSVLSGDKALYVVDAVNEYAYDNAASADIYAYRTFLFEPGEYQISYDWKCNGEGENDYGRVFLAPVTEFYISAGTEIGADTLSDRCIALHEVNKLSGSTDWKHETQIINVEKLVNYHLVVQWSNDGMYGVNPPLSIDNISIGRVECGIIKDLNLHSVTKNEAVVVFENSIEGGSVEYKLSETTNVEEAIKLGEISSDTIVLSGLEAGKQYYLYVRPLCKEDVVSPWVMLPFTTECLAIEVTATTPYIEDFEKYDLQSMFDFCWSEEHISGENSWMINGVGDDFSSAKAHSGSKYMALSSRGGSNKNKVMRTFTLKGDTYYKISLFAYQSDPSSVYMNIVEEGENGLNVLTRKDVINSDYQKYSVEFYASQSGDYRLGFMGEMLGTLRYLLIDDFSVEEIAVGTPFGLNVENVSGNSVDLLWEGNSADYEVQILKGSVLVMEKDTDLKKLQVTGLQPSTKYTAKVRAVYGGETSDWASIEFTTQCGVVYPPYMEDFESTDLTNIPSCWDRETKTSLGDNIYNWSVVLPNEYDPVKPEYGKFVQIQCASTTGYSTLQTSDIMLDGDYTLSFKYANTSEVEALKVVVQYKLGSDTLSSLGDTDGDWVYVRYDLSKYNNQQVKIGFYTSAHVASAAVIALDEIRVVCFNTDIVYEDQICQPTQGSVTYRKNGFEVSSSSLEIGLNTIEKVFEAQSLDACDTLKVLRLTLNPSGVYHYNDTICEGESYNKGAFAGKNLVLPGYYDALLKSSCGCDSTVRLNLTVLNVNNSISATICEGESYSLGDKEISETGIYVDTLINSRGCDSIVVLTLTVIPKYYETNTMLCEGDKIEWFDTVLTTTGRYERVFKNVSGCDSIEVLNLTVLESIVEVYDTICLGDDYKFVDTLLSESGLYVRTFTNALRCDSTVYLHLYVAEPIPAEEHDYICEGELYSGYGYKNIVITQDTMLIQRISMPDRCDSLIHVYVDYVETIEIDTLISIADGDIYEFGERSLSKAGEYREVFVSSVGCDSIVNLTLVVGTGTDDVYALPLVIAPNPILGGEVTYVNRTWTAEEQRGLTLEIVNAMGQVIMVDKPQRYPIAIEGIDVRGVYIVRIVSGAGDTYIGRIVVN